MTPEELNLNIYNTEDWAALVAKLEQDGDYVSANLIRAVAHKRGTGNRNRVAYYIRKAQTAFANAVMV